jgi:hypothetical protein
MVRNRGTGDGSGVEVAVPVGAMEGMGEVAGPGVCDDGGGVAETDCGLSTGAVSDSGDEGLPHPVRMKATRIKMDRLRLNI